MLKLTSWVKSWNPYEATVGAATLNDSLNPLPKGAQPFGQVSSANLSLFHHFHPAY
ncbi:DUF4213 domain-containing protein [Magnetococcus sp. PR-3]|uniref:DUF4213 domain-containing protein n=1 Tax=Magnetococcus sp. PR-3 TaxID=3120355 RepID=UPI003FA5E507